MNQPGNAASGEDEGGVGQTPSEHPLVRDNGTYQILESITNAFFVLDRQCCFVYINAAAEQLLERSRSTLIGEAAWRLFPEAIAKAFYREYSQVLDRQISTQFEEFYAPLKRWLRVHISPSGEGLVVWFEDITEKTQAKIELQNRLEHERLIDAIAQRIKQSHQIEYILGKAVSDVRSVLNCDCVVLFQFHTDGLGKVLVESVAEDWMSISETVIQAPRFSSICIEDYLRDEASILEKIYNTTLSPCHSPPQTQLHARAELAEPVFDGRQLWGFLLAHHCSAVRQWHSFEVKRFKQLATQFGIAVQQSKLHQKVQQLNTNLELQVNERTRQLQQSLDFEATLKRITDKVRDSLDEKQILQSAIEELAKQLNVLSCDTGLYDLEHGVSVVSYEYASKADLAIHGKVWQMDDYPYLYAQLMAGESFQLCHPHIFRGWVTLLACPLQDDSGVLGDLVLCRPASESFSEIEIRLIKQVSNQCAIALRQAFLYREAQKQVEQLEHLNRLKDDFLSTVSHELRTPLSNIKMTLETLEIVLTRMGIWEPDSCLDIASIDGKTKKAADQLQRYMQILKDESQREINLVNDLLDLSRLDSGVEPLILAPVNLQELIPHLTEAFTDRIESQQQTLYLDFASTLVPVITDRGYLERVVVELLNNACKYTPKGETIGISVQAQLTGWELRVTNTGVEIPLGECDRIFDRFYRIPNSDPWKHGGTGIGLALVKKLVEVLGASIRVESHDKLTQFIIQFADRPPGQFVTGLAGGKISTKPRAGSETRLRSESDLT